MAPFPTLLSETCWASHTFLNTDLEILYVCLIFQVFLFPVYDHQWQCLDREDSQNHRKLCMSHLWGTDRTLYGMNGAYGKALKHVNLLKCFELHLDKKWLLIPLQHLSTGHTHYSSFLTLKLNISKQSWIQNGTESFCGLPIQPTGKF